MYRRMKLAIIIIDTLLSIARNSLATIARINTQSSFVFVERKRPCTCSRVRVACLFAIQLIRDSNVLISLKKRPRQNKKETNETNRSRVRWSRIVTFKRKVRGEIQCALLWLDMLCYDWQYLHLRKIISNRDDEYLSQGADWKESRKPLWFLNNYLNRLSCRYSALLFKSTRRSNRIVVIETLLFQYISNLTRSDWLISGN